MRKVLRGYAKDKDGNLVLIGMIPYSKISRRQENVKTKDIWAGKAQRSLRRKLFEIEKSRKYPRKFYL
jgi:hypothetical protein